MSAKLQLFSESAKLLRTFFHFIAHVAKLPPPSPGRPSACIPRPPPPRSPPDGLVIYTRVHLVICIYNPPKDPPPVAALGARQGAAWSRVGFTLELGRRFYNNVRVREHSRSTRARPKSIFIIIIIKMCVALCAAVCAAVCVVDTSQTPCGRAFRCAVGCVVRCAVGCAVAVLRSSGAQASGGGRPCRQRRAPIGRRLGVGRAGWRRRPLARAASAGHRAGSRAPSTARACSVGRASLGHPAPSRRPGLQRCARRLRIGGGLPDGGEGRLGGGLRGAARVGIGGGRSGGGARRPLRACGPGPPASPSSAPVRPCSVRLGGGPCRGSLRRALWGAPRPCPPSAAPARVPPWPAAVAPGGARAAVLVAAALPCLR